MKGIVKSFSSHRGYGFIIGEDKVEYFVHYRGILGAGHRNLIQGEEVKFDVGTWKDKTVAKNVLRPVYQKARALAFKIMAEPPSGGIGGMVDAIYAEPCSVDVQEEAISIIRAEKLNKNGRRKRTNLSESEAVEADSLSN